MKQIDATELHTIRIFLAYSESLEIDSNALKNWVKLQNPYFKTKYKVQIKLLTWQVVSERLTTDRSQNLYNDLIAESDIFILLVWKQLGEYSMEEFEHARKLFLLRQQPEVIIYQKLQGKVDSSLAAWLEQFQVKGQEYFYGKYKGYRQLQQKIQYETELYMLRNGLLEPDTHSKVREEMINGLINRYRSRLNKKLDDEINFELELNLNYTTEGTTIESSRALFIDEFQDGPTGGFDELVKAFEKDIKRLLILGEPGSGKTVLMLQLGLRLLQKARDKKQYPIPVIVNLASWRSYYPAFRVWLEDALTDAGGAFGISKNYARKLIAGNELILLLDGFDEIPQENRESCFRQMGAYFRFLNERTVERPGIPQVVITSRRQEYVGLEVDAPVRASCIIIPLTPGKILEKFEKIHKHNDAAALMLAKFKDGTASVLDLTTAFQVNLALHTFGKVDLPSLTIEHLLPAYCTIQLTRLSKRSRERYFFYLSYIASETNDVSFGLPDIQASWIIPVGEYEYDEKKFQQVVFRITIEFFRMFLVLFLGFLCFFIPLYKEKLWKTSTSDKMLMALVFSGIIVLIPGIINAIFYWRFTDITTRESRTFYFKGFDWHKLIQGFRLVFLRAFLFCMVLGGVIAVVIAMFTQAEKYTSVDFSDRVSTSFSIAWDHVFDGVNGKTYPWIFYVTTACISVIFVGIGILTDHKSIKAKVKVSSNKFIYALKIIDKFLTEFFLGASMFYLVIGCLIGFLIGLGKGPFSIFFTNVAIGLTITLPVALIAAIISSIRKGAAMAFFKIKQFHSSGMPYRRLSAGFYYTFFTIVSPLLGVAFFFMYLKYRNTNIFNNDDQVNILIMSSIIIGFALVVAFYNSALLKHFALRTLLSLRRHLPWRLRSFLNAVSSKSGLMEKDGSRWRFRHQFIKYYFQASFDYEEEEDWLSEIPAKNLLTRLKTFWKR